MSALTVARSVSGGSLTVPNVSVIAIGGRALAIEGPPGSGKSSLALALIDRGAQLIGDDGAIWERVDDKVLASPPPNITGKLEIRGIGLIDLPVAPPTPLSLILTLNDAPERLPDGVPARDVLGVAIPCLAFDLGKIAPAVRAEWALALHGLKSASNQK